MPKFEDTNKTEIIQEKKSCAWHWLRFNFQHYQYSVVKLHLATWWKGNSKQTSYFQGCYYTYYSQITGELLLLTYSDNGAIIPNLVFIPI